MELWAVPVPMGCRLRPPVKERGASKEAVCGKRIGVFKEMGFKWEFNYLFLASYLSKNNMKTWN